VTARRFLVHGRVQGVGFRWFVARQATRLGLVGYAQNQADGSVEVVAQGTEAALDTLAQALARGPALAQVTNVENTNVPHDLERFTSFETR
jgi:acylphosphatase